MNTKVIRDLSEQLFSTRTLCDWFKLYSVLTWNKIGFTRRSKKLRINETTITQDLVFNFWVFASDSPMPVELYESKDEKANGNDLEIIIETNRGFLLLPTQCKIVNRSEKYSSIKHNTRGTDQIDLLLNYAKRKKGMALYLLYNYCEEWKWNSFFEEDPDIPRECYGCSIISAQYLKENFQSKKKDHAGKPKWIVPTFEALHPFPALPFHFLLCTLQNVDLTFWIQSFNFPGIVDNSLHFYSKEELNDKNFWINLAPPPAIGYIPNEEANRVFNDLKAKAPAKFNPKYRIIFSKERGETFLLRNIS